MGEPWATQPHQSIYLTAHHTHTLKVKQSGPIYLHHRPSTPITTGSYHKHCSASQYRDLRQLSQPAITMYTVNMNWGDTTDETKHNCLNCSPHPMLQVSRLFTWPLWPCSNRLENGQFVWSLTFIYQVVYSPRSTHIPDWQQGCENSWWINKGRHKDLYKAVFVIWFMLPSSKTHTSSPNF